MALEDTAWDPVRTVDGEIESARERRRRSSPDR